MTTTSGTEAPDAPAPVLERPDWASTAAGVIVGGVAEIGLREKSNYRIMAGVGIR